MGVAGRAAEEIREAAVMKAVQEVEKVEEVAGVALVPKASVVRVSRQWQCRPRTTCLRW
jgi:hypothetical protein